MSEYQYYEFCRLYSPITAKIREKMSSLSSRANITSHGASYVYNYSYFDENPKKLLFKYFDVFFYITNWGDVDLKFKYPIEEVNFDILKKYKFKDLISVTRKQGYVLLEIEINNEDPSGWIDGEGILPKLLPLYEELKNNNYQFLDLVLLINDAFNGETSLKEGVSKMKLSKAQKDFLKII